MGSREKEQAGGVRSPGDIAACPDDVSAQAVGVHFGTCTVIVIVRGPPGVPSFILASELLRLDGREAHPTSPLVLACQSPRSVLAPLPESYPLGSIDTESLCERNTESIYAVVN